MANLPHIGIWLILQISKRLCAELNLHKDQIYAYSGNNEGVATAIAGLLTACEVLHPLLESLLIIGD